MCVQLCSTRQVFVVDTCSSSSVDHLSLVPHLGRETTLSSLVHLPTNTHTRTPSVEDVNKIIKTNKFRVRGRGRVSVHF